MTHTIVLGGGLCGLAAALMLARDGHDVTVLERDRDPRPADPEAGLGALAARRRRRSSARPTTCSRSDARCSTPSFQTSPAHSRPRARCASTRSPRMPPAIADRAPRPGDERFVTFTARRTRSSLRSRGRRGRAGRRSPRRPRHRARAARRRPRHVTAFAPTRGERLAADLVVDAMGRRSALPKLLGGRGDPAEEAEDCGFLYYTRFFRGELPELRGAPLNRRSARSRSSPCPATTARGRDALRVRARPAAQGGCATWRAGRRSSAPARSTHIGSTASRSPA